jgi:diguanylate cyclase (GGDEF)-like protein
VTPDRPLQILVIDDDDVGREIVCRLSTKTGLNISVREAKSIGEGADCLLEGDIDCAILDYHLGDGTAFEMLARVRDKSPGFIVPTILLTGVGNEEIAVKALKLGINDYINKDHLDAKSLGQAIRTAVAEHKFVVADSQYREALEHRSLHDELTGMPNRRLFLDRLDERIHMAQRTGEAFALMMLDLDMFKSINDTLGHAAGDFVLQVIGERLLAIARRTDTYARLGSDEFSILIDGTIDGAVVVAQKIAGAVADPIEYEERVIKVDASIGIATYPQHGREAELLLSHADQAMYASKQSARRFSVYSGADDSPLHESARISMEIPRLAQPDQVELHYQPKYRLGDGAMIGVEALARWQHSVLGNIPPDKFIPILERSKFIFDFTDIVFNRALAQAASWRAAGHRLKMSVNVSVQSLDRVGFVSHIKELLARYELPPEELIIEITETASLISYDRSAKILRLLAEHGVGISIDDFGTGYTSIRYLRDFPVSELKIDRLFVRSVAEGQRDYSIVSGIVRLAQGLGASTVAEGIESVETVRALSDVGCDYGQGYYLARPTVAAEVTGRLVAGKAGSEAVLQAV